VLRSIRSRLFIGYASVIFLLVLTVTSALLVSRSVQQHFDSAVHADATVNSDLSLRLGLLGREQSLLQAYVITGRHPYFTELQRTIRALSALRQKTQRDARAYPGMLGLLVALTKDEQAWARWAEPTITHIPRDLDRAWFRDEMARGESLSKIAQADLKPLFAMASGQQQQDLSSGPAALDLLKVLLTIIFVASTLVAVVVAWLMTRAITRPLAHLAARAEVIRGGDMTGAIHVEGASEFQALGKSMETMRAQLLHDSVEREGYEQNLAQFAAIVESADDAVTAMDSDGVIASWNPGAERLYGYAASEVIGKSITILEPLDLHGEVTRNLRLVVDGGSVEHFEAERVTKAGDLLTVSITVSPLRDSEGRVTGVTAVSRDVTDQKSFEEQLRHQALHDGLTGLPNRTLMHDRLEQALIAARRNSDTVALLVMDLNRFKEVNDSLGHAAGDRLLEEATLRLTAALRLTDTVARLGGDEFAIVLPASGRQQAEHTVRKLLVGLRRPIMLHDHQIDVDASFGVAMFPENGESPETLLRHADVAMYAAKRARLGHSFYAAEHDLNSPSHLALIAGLRDAIEHGKLLLHFQPIVSLSTGRVERVEALARWRRDGHGFVPPSQFIPLAEETGLIEPLTLLVLKLALEQCAAWKRDGLDLGVAVNLSASSLLNPNLSDVVEAALQHAGVEGTSLMVEVTESALMAKPHEATAVLDHLHKLGIRIAIDDFGTGYSSLSYLQQLPVDEIKIDRSFIQKMARDEQAIVRTVIDLGQNLELQVTAEGVEDEETWIALRAMSCSTAQGYFISRPMPAAAVASWIEAWKLRPHIPDPQLSLALADKELQTASAL
jgi:diguanylate cyclase (GGDEF)-like protein/PAS domain S-box-containing protein